MVRIVRVLSFLLAFALALTCGQSMAQDPPQHASRSLVSEPAAVPIDTTPGPSTVRLAYDPTTENYFALIRWGNDWGLFMSENQGMSWSELYRTSSFLVTGLKVDLTVQGGYAYVVNSQHTIADSYVAGIRRYDTTTGSLDGTYGSHTVRADDTYIIKDIGIAVSATGSIFYVMLLSNGVVVCYISSASTPSSWAMEPTLISNADRGLDVKQPPKYEVFTNAVLLYVSYVSTSNVIYLSRLHKDWNFSTPVYIDTDVYADKTGLTAYGRDVVIAWECIGTTYQAVCSKHAEEQALQGQTLTTWPQWESGSGDLYDPIPAATTDSNRNAMVYESSNQIIYREHTNYDNNWGTDTTIVNYYPFTAESGDRFAFEWMGSEFGIAYFDANGVYFYREGVIFADGFESGDTAHW